MKNKKTTINNLQTSAKQATEKNLYYMNTPDIA